MINEVKVTEIERENRILYEKMSRIFTRKSGHKPKDKLHTIQTSFNISQFKDRNRKIYKMKINEDNKKILKRIQDSSATYNVDKWLDDHRKTRKYVNIRSQKQNNNQKKPQGSTSMANYTSYNSVRKIFGHPRQSDDMVNIHPVPHDNDTDSATRFDRYSAFSNNMNSQLSNHRKNTIPDVYLPKDSISITNRDSAYEAHELEDLEYKSNLEKLKRIRNSVRSVDLHTTVKRKRLYQGIAIISQKEFYIDIFKTKTKFYISAIELAQKTPHMIELFINQGKKLIHE